MKRIFYLFTFALLGLNFAYSQDLTTLTQEGRQWSTHVWWAVSPPQDYTEVYRMEGDTTLGGKTYKKIYCYHTRDLSDRKLYPYYACRQEDKKVFVYFYEALKEKMLFDFSLKVGDTFSVEERYCNMMVTTVGDTTINGRASRYLRLVNRDTYNLASEDIWVEGIGSLYYGINWDGMYQMFGSKIYTLLCCHQENDLLWKNPKSEDCFEYKPKPDITPYVSPWFPDKAEWYYGLFDEFNFGMHYKTGCIHMTVEKDTLFAGRMCKQLKLSSCVGDFETLYEYVYSKYDRLYYYNYAAQDFFLLLNLLAKVGDTIWVHDTKFVPNPGFDPYRHSELTSRPYFFMAYTILDVSTVEMGGKQLIRQKVKPVDSRKVNGKTTFSNWRFASVYDSLDIGYVVEGIGSLGGFWGETAPLTPESGYYKLRCFSAGDQTYMTDGKCDNVAVEPAWVLNSAQWQFSPQPAGETVQAVCTASDAAWQKGRWYLHDLSGRRLQSGTFTDGCFEVSLRGVPHGMYMIEIKAAQDNGFCRLKCVKGL